MSAATATATVTATTTATDSDSPAIPPAVGIIGLGLIGGSLAMAIKQRSTTTKIIAYDHHADCLQFATANGIIDQPAAALSDLAGCDLIIIATPVQAAAAAFVNIASWLAPHTIITDTGSTKRNIIAAARAHLTPAQCQQFVPAHPIAGKENSSITAATASLFHQCKVVLCTDFANSDAIARIARFWQALSAQSMYMDSDQHDKIFSLVSHLPHLLSYALVHVIRTHSHCDTLTDFMAGGFYDFTRIASSHPAMWRDIATANADHIGEALRLMQDEFATLQTAVADGDSDTLHQRFAAAKSARDSWLADGDSPALSNPKVNE